MIFWYAVVLAVLAACVMHLVQYIRENGAGHHRPDFFGTYKEEDIFFVPGDRMEDEDDCFEDL